VATLQPTADRNGIVAGSRQMFVNASGGPTHFEIGPDGNLYYTEIVGGGSSTVEVVKPKNPITCTITTGSGGASGSGGTTAGGGTSGGGTTASTGGTGSPNGGTTAGVGAGVGGGTSGGGTSASGGGTT